MLKMLHVASALSADEKELKLTSLLYSLSSPHPRHHALEVWWIVYKFHIPQKLYVLQMSGTDIHKQQYVPTLHTNEDIQYP